MWKLWDIFNMHAISQLTPHSIPLIGCLPTTTWLSPVKFICYERICPQTTIASSSKSWITCLSIQRDCSGNSLEIWNLRFSKGWRNCIWHLINLTCDFLLRANLGHLWDGERFRLMQSHAAEQSHDHNSHLHLPLCHYRELFISVWRLWSWKLEDLSYHQLDYFNGLRSVI